MIGALVATVANRWKVWAIASLLTPLYISFYIILVIKKLIRINPNSGRCTLIPGGRALFLHENWAPVRGWWFMP